MKTGHSGLSLQDCDISGIKFSESRAGTENAIRGPVTTSGARGRTTGVEGGLPELLTGEGVRHASTSKTKSMSRQPDQPDLLHLGGRRESSPVSHPNSSFTTVSLRDDWDSEEAFTFGRVRTIHNPAEVSNHVQQLYEPLASNPPGHTKTTVMNPSTRFLRGNVKCFG